MQKNTYHLSEWTPKLNIAAHEIVSKIQQAAPELKVLFMGAGALGLPGKNDIDLDVLCNAKDLDKYTQKINDALGVEATVKDGKAFWGYEHKGFEIDCLLSDPAAANSHIQRQKQNFEILKARPDLREKYTQLKRNCDGKPYSEYEAKKAEFLDQLPNL